MADTSFMLTGIPPNKSWSGMRGAFGFNEEGLQVVVSGFKVDGDKRERYEAGFHFHADPLEIAAAMVLSLVRSNDALFAWTGSAGESGDPWVLRAHWFRYPSSLTRDLKDLEQLLEAGSEVDTESGIKVLSRLKRQTAREPLYSLTVEQVVSEGRPVRFPFVLQPASQAGVFSACRKAALNRDDLYLVGGLRVMTNKGDVCLAAGSSSLIKLSPDQRSALRLGIQKAIESERAVPVKMKEVGCFVPRRSNGQSFWSTGMRMSVLGRTAPLSSAKDAAKLLAVL